MVVKVEAPKRRSLAWVVAVVMPDEAVLLVPLAWLTLSTGFVADTPLYSWTAALILPDPTAFTVTVKFEPPLTLAAYQMLIGSSFPVAGEGSSTALVYVFPKLSVTPATTAVLEAFQVEAATTIRLPEVTGAAKVAFWLATKFPV
jgi:hypothetical protein